jgi:multidrug efflux system membrane fusion protein
MARRRFLVISAIAIAIAVALAGVGAWYMSERSEPAVKATAAQIPVTVAVASRGDLPIYLSGLVTVQASFTAGIRPQVDGKLKQALFKEGDHVRKRDKEHGNAAHRQSGEQCSIKARQPSIPRAAARAIWLAE